MPIAALVAAWLPAVAGLQVVQSVTSLEGIQNFRAVSPRLPGIYRSAGLEKATAADVAYLLDGAKIRTIIDLRNDDEVEQSLAEATSYGAALLEAFDEQRPVGTGCVASEGCGTLSRTQVPILQDVDGFYAEVAERLTGIRKIKAPALKATNGRAYDQLLYDELARQKQPMLNTVMLKTSAGWGEALSLAADRSGGSVLFHCAQGKDRTGVLAALLQHAAGCDEADIVASYAQSGPLLGHDLDKPAPRPQQTEGVDWSCMRGSPPEAMTETLAWIRAEYGAIDSFLESVGCGEAWRRTLLQR